MPSPTFSYRHQPCAVIVKGRATTHSLRGNRYELTWYRYVHDDGDVVDELRQQRWDSAGRRHETALPVDYGSTAAQMFDRYVELYRQTAEQAAGAPGPGQLSLPGVA
jgi:hypothetical protein